MNWHVTISGLTQRLGMSRQNFYRECIARQRAEVDEGFVLALVIAERAVQPRIGVRKLYRILTPILESEGIKLGRDKFFDLLRKNDLLVPPLPKSSIRTTWFEPCLPVFCNLVIGLELTGPNQAWAADITYIRTDERFLYLSLITDMWSRMIVGFHLGDSLEAAEAVLALVMALATLRPEEKPLHHSDRGCQYASHLYVGKLREAGLQISMTEELHCYENALAERVNGILKQEYYLSSCFKNKAQAKAAVEQAVYLYNTRRPHMSLGYQTPEKMHQRTT